MTIEEALQLPGPKVQAWSVSPAHDGLVTLALYEVGPGGAEYLAGGRFPEAQVSPMRTDLEGRGARPAGTSDGAEYVWLEHDGGVTVYTTTAVVLEATGDRLTASEGSWPRDALARIIAFAAADFIKRGVKAALRTGAEVDVLTDISSAAYSDPTYGPDELLIDAEWCAYVAGAVSRWAGLGGIELRGL
jgi:hypothetical protein